MKNILVFALAISLPITMTSQGQKGRMEVSNTLGGEGLSVVDAHSPAFLPEIETLLGPTNSSVGKDLLPLCLLLTNKTTKSIWGFTVIYTFPDKLSGIGKPWTIKNTIAAWGPTDAQFMLGPGDTYLVTPVSDLSVHKYSNGQVLAPPAADEGLLRYIQNFTKEFLGGRVTVQIDSVIFDNGTMIGADDAGLLGRVNNRINAEKDLLNSVQSLSGKGLRDYLRSSKTPELKDEYFSHRASRAQELEGLLDANGEAEFKNQLNLRRYGHWFDGNELVVREGK